MAYVKDKLTIIEKMRELGTVCFSITETDGKTIHENDNDEMSPEEARDSCHKMLDELEGTVKVILRSSAKKNRNIGGNVRDNHYYTIRLSEKGQTNDSVNGLNNNIIGYLTQINDLKFEAFKKEVLHEKELEKLKNKSNENSGLEIYKSIMNDLKPFLPLIANKLNMQPIIQAAPGIAGNVEDKIQEEKINPEEVKRIQIAVASLLQSDQNFVSNIEKLAEFCKRFPADYVSIIPMLDFKLNS